jgi:putative ABC transport system permease protein
VVRYLKPLGFTYENVWVLHLHAHNLEKDLTEEDIRATLAQVRQEMEAQPEIGRVSFISSNYPYGRSRWRTILKCDERDYYGSYWQADDNFAEVVGLRILEGRWFNREDDASLATPIVLTRQMREEMFGDESPFRTIQTHNGKDRIIVGVADTYRYRGEFENPESGHFERHEITDTASSIPYQALFSVRADADARLEGQILKQLSSIAHGWNLRIETLTDARKSYMRENLLAVGIFVTIAGFLVFNVALGLFGVLWQSISRRRGEVGLRRAVGATKGHIAGQILIEILVMATLAIAVGIFVACQVPVLGLDTVLTGLEVSISGTIYALAMACAAVMIYFITSLCALYPSRLAARVEPAAALHDD